MISVSIYTLILFLENPQISCNDFLNYLDSVNSFEFVDDHTICESLGLSFVPCFVLSIYLSIGLFCPVQCTEMRRNNEKRTPFLVPDTKENTCQVLPSSVIFAVGLLVKEVSLIVNSITCFSPSVEIILLFPFICHFNKLF